MMCPLKYKYVPEMHIYESLSRRIFYAAVQAIKGVAIRNCMSVKNVFLSSSHFN